MARKKQKQTFGALLGVIAFLVLAVVGLSFNIGGMGSSSNDSDSDNLDNSNVVQCSKDYEKTVNFVARDEYERGTSVNNVTYQVWKNLGDIKVPQPDSQGSLDVAYGEEYEVVAMADGYKSVQETFSVDDNCNGPEDTVFYMTALPQTVDVTLENSKITGPNSNTNRVPISPEMTRTIQATFNGETKTSTDTIIVINANKDEFEVDSSLASAPQPEEHTTLTNFKSYTFELGTLEQFNDLNANFNILANENLVAGDYNVSYTIYQYANGYVDEDSGEYVVQKTVEGNDEVLLPTFTGDMFLTVE